jgi:DNA-binding MarR family transcriptional regulator
MASRAITKQSKRRELLEKLRDLGRQMSTQTVFLHQALAQGVGLNATDAKCIDLILRAPEGRITAGRLSEMSGLTTGAVTHILDRLEKRGFVVRARDTDDRRKVFVRVRLESLETLVPQYEAIGKAFLQLADEYRDDELQLICDYMERAAVVSERELAKLVTARRDPGHRVSREVRGRRI